jgi:hypothetical protein
LRIIKNIILNVLSIALLLGLIACGTKQNAQSNRHPSLVFEGITQNYWLVEMVVTDKSTSKQEVKVNYKYIGLGKNDNLSLFNNLSFSFDGAVKGSKTIDSYKGITKRNYTITVINTGAKITKNNTFKANIDMGAPGLETKYSTKLVYSPKGLHTTSNLFSNVYYWLLLLGVVLLLIITFSILIL